MIVGIRREDKNRWERRAPLIPEHMRDLARDHGLRFVVQPSPIRAFPDAAYAAAGAEVNEDLSAADVVLAVKEVPISLFRAGKTYLFFSHTLKGQRHNMPMLRRVLDLGCTLIDYERIVDDQCRRLIFFGRYAGLAGMIDALWALGRRFEWEGVATPLGRIEPAHRYPDLAAARAAFREVADRIAAGGLPEAAGPIVVGLAGYGNVSRGAQEILDLFPVEELSPPRLLDPSFDAGALDRRTVYKVVFREEHMAAPIDAGKPFDLAEYYSHPERYRGLFPSYVPSLTVAANCIFWEARFPRLVSIADARALWAGPRPRCRVLADISCDVGGGIEVNDHCTDPGDPVYVWDLDKGASSSGVAGKGPIVLAVDNLPCELPRESSAEFGALLSRFLPAIARAELTRPPAESGLPVEMQRGVIAYQGRLTPAFAYLQEHLDRAAEG